MVLGYYSACGWIPHKYHAASMERQVPKLYFNIQTQITFWWACASRTLEAGIDCVDWKKERIVIFYWNIVYFNAVQNIFWHSDFEVGFQTVQPFYHIFDSKWPKYFVNNLRPHCDAV